jgi:PadR family transcriptional regulator PadR
MITGRDIDLAQMRKGILEFCVLARLRDTPAYGLELASTLGQDRYLFSSEGTLYPLLARLRKQGWVSTTWRESSGGPPRRYYELTADGATALDSFTTTWTDFRRAVDAVLEGSA